MWNNSKSLLLSRILLILGFCLWIMGLIGVYILCADEHIEYFIIYLVLVVPISLIMYELNKILCNISKSEIFTEDNISRLRLISWICLFVAIFLIFCCKYLSILIICAGVIGFFGLFMRVVKNIINEAMLYKIENDYTI